MSSRSAALCVLPPEKRCESVMSSSELFVRSDADVIHASCGDPAEFGEIFRRYFPRVYAYLVQRLPRDAAEDAASRVFEIALQKRASYEPVHETALPWLYGISCNVVAKHKRSVVRGARAYARVASSDTVITLSPATGATERVDAASDVAFLSPAIEALSSRDQHILHLTAYAELSPTEIATSLGIPAGTVRSRLHRIRRHLTKAFASKGA